MKRFSKAVRSLTDRITADRLRAAAYILIGLLCFLMQMTPHGFPAPFGARAVLLLPFTVCVAMFAGPVAGGWAGIASGLFWDVYADRLFGLNALLLLLIGCTCGLLVRLLLRNNLLTAVILSGGALAAHGLLDWLLNTALLKVEGAFFALWHITLPNVVYTWLLALPMYLLFAAIERKLQKLR